MPPSPSSLAPRPAPRVAFVTSHPIQYQVPVFRHLTADPNIDFEVLFAMLPDAAAQGAGFGVHFEWDIPLLEGYNFSVLNNVSKNQGVTHFSGCDTPEVHDVLKRRKIDVVVVNGWVVKTCLQTLNACRRLGIPCIVRGEANHLRPRPWWKRLLQRQLVRRYDAYLTIGTVNRDFYRSYGVSDDRMFDAKYCIENERFIKASEACRDRRTEFRSNWNIADGKTCFLFCGKFEEKKHPVQLIQCLADAVQQGANIHLLMVGDGDLKRECELRVQEKRLPVTFTGFLNQTEIVNAYIAADVLALPSDHGETWGLVANEAMVCGLPVLASNQVGCVEDLITNNETGWTFEFGQWQQLTSLLLQIAEQTDKFPTMADACRSRIADYSPAAASKGVATAVKFVCGHHRSKSKTVKSNSVMKEQHVRT